MNHKYGLTVEVLSIQLLDKLQHHAVQSTLPQMVSSGKTFSPCSFSALVFSIDSKLKLADEFIDKTILFRYTIQGCNNGASLFTSARPKKMTTNKIKRLRSIKEDYTRHLRRFWKEKDTREQDESPDQLQANRNSPGC